jgi:hypothetical protein
MAPPPSRCRQRGRTGGRFDHRHAGSRGDVRSWADRLFATVAPTRYLERGVQVTATIDLQRSFVFDVRTGERLHPAQHDTT